MDINNKKATRQSYGEALVELGKVNKDVIVLDADVSGATKTNLFAKAAFWPCASLACQTITTFRHIRCIKTFKT